MNQPLKQRNSNTVPCNQLNLANFRKIAVHFPAIRPRHLHRNRRTGHHDHSSRGHDKRQRCRFGYHLACGRSGQPFWQGGSPRFIAISLPTAPSIGTRQPSLFDLERAALTRSDAWTAFFVQAVTDHVVWGREAHGDG